MWIEVLSQDISRNPVLSLICMVVPAIFFWIITSIVRSRERKRFNDGICRETGLPWTCFDMDSQGGRMYTDGEGNYCDVSYGSVDKAYRIKRT